MHLGLRHQLGRKKHGTISKRSPLVISAMDTLAYVASFLALLFTTDQVRVIWVEHNAGGVSLFSWAFYTISAFVWFGYGWVHREKILIVTNFFWIILNLWIVVGILIYK